MILSIRTNLKNLNYKFLNNLKNLNYKFLFSIFVGVLLPVIYSFLRVLWIIDNGSMSYAMTSFWAYIQIFIEIFGAFLILPLFTFVKRTKNKKSWSILIITILILVSLILLLSALIPFLIKSMMIMNPDAIKSELRLFLFLSIVANVIVIFERFLIASLVVEEKQNKVYSITAFSITLKITFDILLLSSISPIPFSIINLAISEIISSMIIIAFLLVIWTSEYFKENIHLNFDLTEAKNFYRRGFVPGIEVAIRNFFYAFVTLAIVNSLGELAWNSWHLGSWVYWNIIFCFTVVFEYALLSERINNDKLNHHVLTYMFLVVDAIIFLILGPISIFWILPLIVDQGEWLSLTTKTAFIMLPFMFMLAALGKFRTKFITEDKLRYLLYNAIIVNLIVELPIYIMLLNGHLFNYKQNLIIWVTAVSFEFFIAWYQFELFDSQLIILKFKVNNYFNNILLEFYK